jgi:hypothetical protein
LFVYAIARPRKEALADTAQLAAWTAEEDDREQRVVSDGGRYYPPTAVEDTLALAVANTLSLLPAARAWRVAAASTARAVGRHVPPGVRRRMWQVPGAKAAWRRLVH